jgi:GNAT superfamily N-acetyltransferase
LCSRPEGNVQVSVRLARPGDAPRIAVLSGQLGYPVSQGQVEQRLDQIRHDESSAVFVAELSDGRVMGWVQVCVRKLIMADKQGEIDGLVVDEGCRGCEIGRTLAKQAERWAGAKGCEVVSLRSNVVRKGARPFYEGIGYSLVKTQWAFRKVLKIAEGDTNR